MLGVIGIYGIINYGRIKETDDNTAFVMAVFFTTFFVNYSGFILWMIIALVLIIFLFVFAMILGACGIVSSPQVSLVTSGTDVFGNLIQNLAGIDNITLNRQELDKLKNHVREVDQNLLDLMKNHQEEKCSICMENYTIGSQVLILPGCHHSFCETCSFTWFEKKANCLICRSDIKPMLNMNKIESEEVFDKPTNYGSTTINESDKCSDIEKETLIYVPSTGKKTLI